MMSGLTVSQTTLFRRRVRELMWEAALTVTKSMHNYIPIGCELTLQPPNHVSSDMLHSEMQPPGSADAYWSIVGTLHSTSTNPAGRCAVKRFSENHHRASPLECELMLEAACTAATMNPSRQLVHDWAPSSASSTVACRKRVWVC